MKTALVPHTSAPPSLAERLTSDFYAWERRGRGWRVSPDVVELEPPFRPFYHGWHPDDLHNLASDDGRKPTVLSRLAELVLGRDPPRSVERIWHADVEDPDPVPRPPNPVVELSLGLPPDLAVTATASEQLLVSLSACMSPVGFELVASGNALSVQFTCDPADQDLVEQQLLSQFPTIQVEANQGRLRDAWDKAPGGRILVDFGLAREFMLPINAPSGLSPDPLTPLIGALAGAQEGEIAVLQVIFAPTREPWAESAFRAVTDGAGGSFFHDAPQFPRLATEKLSRPLFAALVRFAARSARPDRLWSLARATAGGIRTFARPDSNELIPLSNADYDDEEHEADLIARASRRCGMLLSSAELIGLVHVPSQAVQSPALRRERARTKACPESAQTGDTVLGENRHRGAVRRVALTTSQRVRHVQVIGASGTGKSHLLLTLITQDLRRGHGLGVMDPHGDLVDRALSFVPSDRVRESVLLDPSDENHPVGFNILAASTPAEKQLIASDLVAAFRRLATSWGDVMTSVLGNAVLAFLESEEGGTLTDLRRFLVEPSYRKRFLGTVSDPQVVYYWEKEFPLLGGKPQGPILTRLDTFLRPRLVRRVVCQPKGGLDLASIMASGGAFFAKLAAGEIGEENARLLGSLLLSKFHQHALSRQSVPEKERRPFFLYVDEFHQFATPSLAATLSGARKFGLGLALAHQDLRQIRDAELEAAILTNPSVRVCFRVGDFDARRLAEGFSYFGAEDLHSLGVGEAICRIERADRDFNLTTLPLPDVDPLTAESVRAEIIAYSRSLYRDSPDAPDRLPVPQASKEQVSDEPPKTAKTTARAPRPRAAAPSSAEGKPRPGKGGAQHTYLQELIRRFAHSRGWRADIEDAVLAGLGSVDVALERGEERIACEITISTPPAHELANVQKCLAAGFGHVAVVSPERRVLAQARAHILETLEEGFHARVRFLTPEELFAFLEEREAASAASQETVRGYAVKVKYRAVGAGEKESKSEAISRVIAQAARRLKSRERRE